MSRELEEDKNVVTTVNESTTTVKKWKFEWQYDGIIVQQSSVLLYSLCYQLNRGISNKTIFCEQNLCK